MAELLTHILVAYILATLLSWRYEWLTPQFVTVAMVGAMIPDLNRLDLLFPADMIEAAIGLPFDWGAFHVLGGSVLAVGIGTLVAPPEYRKRVFALLFLGMASHHAFDLLLVNVSGYTYAVFWPLTQYNPPSVDLYLSSDWWTAAISASIAAVVWYARYGQQR